MTKKYVKRTVIMHSRDTYNATIPSDELVAAMTDLSAGAFKLLMYYYSRKTGWNFDDKEIAKTIGMSERRVKEVRKELVDHKYLLILKGDIDNYFIGRKAVLEWENPDQI